jgi:hypothetical protein
MPRSTHEARVRFLKSLVLLLSAIGVVLVISAAQSAILKRPIEAAGVTRAGWGSIPRVDPVTKVALPCRVRYVHVGEPLS